MKKERNSRMANIAKYEDYEIYDTRYYGLWKSGKGDELKVKIDPKRFQKSTYTTFSKDQLVIINRRRSHYFYPAKPQYYSYHCNEFCDTITHIQKKWTEHFKPLIDLALKRISEPEHLTPGDCDLFMCGILEADEAQTWANFNNMRRRYEYENECYDLVANLYAQFLHLLASRIEAITVKVLTEENALKDHFDRNALYATAVGKRCKIEELPSFEFYDKLYCIWNFIKHNSQSTYEKLHEKHPEVFYKHAEKYTQGDLAIHYLNLSDELVKELIDGSIAFFKEYCELVFGESYAEAQWNYGRYFYDIAQDSIEMITNPMGIPSYI